jgi:hypothetical protein
MSIADGDLAYLDYGVFRLEFTTHQFVRTGNRDYVFDPREP